MPKDSFPAKFSRLEEIIDWFDSDDFDLDKAEAKFEEGVKLATEIKKRLDSAKLKIEKLSK